jgi:hypothetical protein
MRLLLISDTHGKLGIINELVAHVRVDAVIHAGDFGFFDDTGASSVFRTGRFGFTSCNPTCREPKRTESWLFSAKT